MKRRHATTGRIPTRLLQFDPDDWLKRSDLPEVDPEDYSASTDETVRHYSAALERFETAQDEYVTAHPFLAVANALINARQEAMQRFPAEPWNPAEDPP